MFSEVTCLSLGVWVLLASDLEQKVHVSAALSLIASPTTPRHLSAWPTQLAVLLLSRAPLGKQRPPPAGRVGCFR